MPMNAALVGKTYPPAAVTVTAEATTRYARAYNEDNPWFLDERRPGGIVAPPLFGVVVAGPALAQAVGDPELRLSFRRALHGEQDMKFLSPIRPGDTVATTAHIEAVETKATGETLTVGLELTNQDRRSVQRIRFTLFVRGPEAGAPPARVRTGAARPTPRPEPAVVATQRIDADQTFRYAEASGDRTPIHLDDAVAKAAGLPGIILHGLCTMAFTSKVMIDRLAEGDPTRLRRLAVRFARPVLPGDTITTRVWPAGARDGRQVFDFETLNPAGAPVITGGIAEIAG